jgi:hypothetical protein
MFPDAMNNGKDGMWPFSPAGTLDTACASARMAGACTGQRRDYHAHGRSGLWGGGECERRVCAGKVVTDGEGGSVGVDL